MGNNNSINKINFEDIQLLCNSNNHYIINTMSKEYQNCLILNTIPIDKEESTLNELMKKDKTANIIIYGLNCNDYTIYNKYKQLIKCGFTNISIYIGGMFEWLLLQEIYGSEEFPVTHNELDILKYKPKSKFNSNLLMN